MFYLINNDIDWFEVLSNLVTFDKEKQTIEFYRVRIPKGESDTSKFKEMDDFYNFLYFPKKEDVVEFMKRCYNVKLTNFKHISYNLKEGWIEIKTIRVNYWLDELDQSINIEIPGEGLKKMIN